MAAPACRCFGLCAGRAGWVDPETGCACTVCGGSGIWKPAPTAAEEWEAFERKRAARDGRVERSAPRNHRPLPVRRPPAPRAKPRQPGEWNDLHTPAAHARAEAERVEFLRNRAPTREQLDALKKENDAWLRKAKH